MSSKIMLPLMALAILSTEDNMVISQGEAPDNNAATATAGPTITEGLTMTLFGIGELKNEKEWSKYTAEYVANYFSVFEADIEISVEKQETVFNMGGNFCGCPECTLDAWNKDACDDEGFCSTCGERILSYQSGSKTNRKTKREACSQIAGLEFEEECGCFNPLTCASGNTYCGCPLCTPEVWDMAACDDEGFCSTCGERITYLYSVLGYLKQDACIQIAALEYEEACGPCNPLVCNKPTINLCGCSECTSDGVWTKEACDDNGFCSTCGERINFLQSSGRTEREACIEVAGKEHDDVCGECNPLVCSGAPPVFPEEISVLVTFSQILTPSLYDPIYVIQEPFAKEGAQAEYISYLQSQSTDYGGIVSVSPVTVSPSSTTTIPPDGDSGGARNMALIIVGSVIGGMCVFLVVRYFIRRNKSANDVGESPAVTSDLEDMDDSTASLQEERTALGHRTDGSVDGGDSLACMAPSEEANSLEDSNNLEDSNDLHNGQSQLVTIAEAEDEDATTVSSVSVSGWFMRSQNIRQK